MGCEIAASDLKQGMTDSGPMVVWTGGGQSGSSVGWSDGSEAHFFTDGTGLFSLRISTPQHPRRFWSPPYVEGDVMRQLLKIWWPDLPSHVRDHLAITWPGLVPEEEQRSTRQTHSDQGVHTKERTGG